MKARLADGDGTAQLREIAPLLLKGTGGNPLFMTSIVNHFAQRAARARAPAAIASIPDDVRRFIERQIDELGENDCNLLTAASVISREFATAAIAAALKTNVEQLEVACAKIQTSTPTDYKSLLKNYFDLARQFRDHFSIKDCSPHFVGIWDTVSSVGWIENPIRLRYTAGNPDIAIGRHAVAIDERRAFFRTNLWHPAPNGGPKDLKQVWFPGAHCDIGGGYPKSESGLSKIALEWMIK